MAFVDDCGSDLTSEGYGMGLVRSTSFGRKRVSIPNVGFVFGNDGDCITPTPAKRRRLPDSCLCTERSALEDLPQEILIRILCGVDHDDLKKLFFVSKGVREATLIAKKSHFAYSTPKKALAFHAAGYYLSVSDDIEAPNAPKQSRVSRRRLSAKNLADISVSLFASGKEDDWPRRDLFLGMETFE